MSQVNLLPPEIRAKAKARNQSILVGTAGAALIGVLIVLSLLQSVALRTANSDLNAQKAVNSGLEHQAADLQSYQDDARQLEAQRKVVNDAIAYEVSWSSALRDLQLVLPDEVSINTFNGAVSATSAEPPLPVLGSEPPSAIIGSITVDGLSQGSMRVARWLVRVGDPKGWENPAVRQLTEGEGDQWSFDTSVDLFQDAGTPRGQVAGS